MIARLKSLLPRSTDMSLVLGAAVTVAFYGIMYQPALQGTILQRYTTKNPVDYAITFLFFWSLIDVLLKTFSFPREFFAMRHAWLPERSGQEPLANARTILASLASLPLWQRESRVGQRVQKVLQYAVEHGVGQDYRDQIKYLSEKAEDDSHARYSVVRFVIAIAPMLGFLGTVVHFGTALSGISFEEMDSRLGDVVSHMGEAFNTTTSALAVAMTVMFVLFLVERTDRGINTSVDRFVERELETRFEAAKRPMAPELVGVQSAHDDALQIMMTTLDRQAAAWEGAIDRLFERFEARQQGENAAWDRALLSLQSRHEELEVQGATRLSTDLLEFGQRQEAHLDEVHKTLDGIVALRGDFQAVGQTLQVIADGEGRLGELQETLTSNLQTLQLAQRMDEALHGLTAAIHLLTARHRRGEGPGATERAA